MGEILGGNGLLISNKSYVGLDGYKDDSALAAVELFKDYSDELLNFAAVSCVLFMIIGIPGNIITIAALAKYKKVHNATAMFIINLSTSDLLFGCFNLPLAASTFWRRSWAHGKVLCFMFPLARYGLVAVSLFTVFAITINRYILVSHPRLYLKLYTRCYLTIMVVCIWVMTFATLIPTGLEKWGRFSLDPIVGSCSIIPDVHDNSPKKFLFIFAFLLPGIVIFLCYARILYLVKKQTKKTQTPKLKRPLTEIITPEVINATQNETPTQPRVVTISIPHCNSVTELSSSSQTDASVLDRYNGRSDDKLNKTRENMRTFRQSISAAVRRSIAIRPRLPTRKDKKLQTMIMAIMLSFCICHLPITVTKICSDMTSHPTANIMSYVLIYLTTCINPIIYVVMSNEYRQAYKNLFKCRR